MKHHQKQEAVDRGMATTDDLHGNGQADALGNQGPAHGPVDPDATLTRWANLRTRCATSGALWARTLPAEPPAEEADVGKVGTVFPEPPFHLGPHHTGE
eukprot:2664337-Amphidinium_carterae.1